MEQPGEREELFAGELHRETFLAPAHAEIAHIKANKRWPKVLILAGASTALGLCVPVGYHIGVVNAPADIIKAFCNESVYTRYDSVLSTSGLDVLWSTIVSIFLVGGAIGSLTGSWFADRVGRKGSIIISAVLAVLGGILFFASKSSNATEMLLAGRLLVGLSSGLITCVVPMYLTEISPLEYRGAMGVLCPLGITTGVLLGQILGLRQILGTEESWHHLLAFFTIFVLIAIPVMPFLPESPKYLMFIKKQPTKAFKQLLRIRGTAKEFLEEEIHEMKLEAQQSEDVKETWNIAKVLSDRTLLLPLLLVCSMQAGQQLSGINAVFYYSVSIFKSAGLSEFNSQLATIGAGIVNLTMASVSIFTMSYFYRRTIMQISCISAAVTLIVLGLSISYISSTSWMPYLCIIAALAYVLVYGLGLGPIPYFVGSELFEVGPRPSAMALGSMFNWGGNFVVGMSFPTLNSYIGASSFMIFAAITVALFFFVRFYLPETKGRHTADIYELCKNGLRSKVLDSPSRSSTTTTSSPINDIKVA